MQIYPIVGFDMLNFTQHLNIFNATLKNKSNKI